HAAKLIPAHPRGPHSPPAAPPVVCLRRFDHDRSLRHSSFRGARRYLALACFLPNTCMAIGIVLASPDKKSVQPSTFRFSRLNFPASNKPAPNPIAPRVAAINAISGTVTLLGSEMFIVLFSTPLESLGESMRHCPSRTCRFGHFSHDMSGHVLPGMKSHIGNR